MNASPNVPGPPGRFLLGHLPELRRDPLEFLVSCARDYGDVARYRVLHVDVYLISHPDDIETVLHTNSQNFVKGRSLRASRALLGNGLLSSEGELWRRQRRMVQPAFQRDRIAANGSAIVDSAQRLIDAWRPGETLDVHRAMTRLTMQIIAEALFGARVEHEADRVIAALHVFLEQYRAGLLLSARIPTPGNLRLKRATRRLEGIIYRIIRDRRADRAEADDWLSLLLRAQDEAGGSMSDRQLRDELMTLFIAGHETLAASLAWTFYLLSEHPAVESKLANEIEAVLRGRPPGVADLPQLKYTERVVKESLRLYPPAWALPRTALRDCTLGGYRVPAGASVTMSQWIVQRDPRFFDRPTEFDPDRWTDEFTQRLPRFAYFPFGGGPRVCVGASLALMEAALIVATVAQRYRLTLAPGHPVEVWPTLVLQPKHGMKMIVSDRSGWPPSDSHRR